MKVKILGTEYEIIKNAEDKDYPQLKKCDGFTDFSIKRIVVADFDKDESSIDDLEWYKNKVLRHEIVHAFIHESGLAENCEWARNEELTDWIAIQFTKMLEVFIKVGAIEIVFPIKDRLSNSPVNSPVNPPKVKEAKACVNFPDFKPVEIKLPETTKEIVDMFNKAMDNELKGYIVGGDG